MIISRKHRYIFLHCRKTAGSSICVSLARDLGEDEVILSALGETREFGIPLPQRMLDDARAELKETGKLKHRLRASGLRGKTMQGRMRKKLLLQRYRRLMNEQQPQHAWASSMAEHFPDDWAAFPKICVVRNPWTKMVSDYFWRTREMPTRPEFADYVAAIERGDHLGGHVHLRSAMYTIDDQIIADHVVRFENLLPGLTDTLAALNIPFDGWLPRAKGDHRPKTGKKADPRSFYTPELRDTVGRMFEKEINAFGYTFEAVTSASDRRRSVAPVRYSAANAAPGNRRRRRASDPATARNSGISGRHSHGRPRQWLVRSCPRIAP